MKTILTVLLSLISVVAFAQNPAGEAMTSRASMLGPKNNASITKANLPAWSLNRVPAARARAVNQFHRGVFIAQGDISFMNGQTSEPGADTTFAQAQLREMQADMAMSNAQFFQAIKLYAQAYDVYQKAKQEYDTVQGYYQNAEYYFEAL